MNLPPIIQTYITASNAHDVEAIVACFDDHAVVRDENAMQQGKTKIRRWVTETIEKYKFQFKPLSAEEHAAETVLNVEVSGSFPGSPVTLDYHFIIGNDKIESLIIDS